MSQADWAVARAYLALSAKLALQAANIISAAPADAHNKHEAEEMERVGDKVWELLKPWRDES